MIHRLRSRPILSMPFCGLTLLALLIPEGLLKSAPLERVGMVEARAW